MSSPTIVEVGRAQFRLLMVLVETLPPLPPDEDGEEPPHAASSPGTVRAAAPMPRPFSAWRRPVGLVSHVGSSLEVMEGQSPQCWPERARTADSSRLIVPVGSSSWHLAARNETNGTAAYVKGACYRGGTQPLRIATAVGVRSAGHSAVACEGLMQFLQSELTPQAFEAGTYVAGFIFNSLIRKLIHSATRSGTAITDRWPPSSAARSSTGRSPVLAACSLAASLRDCHGQHRMSWVPQ